MAYSSLTLVARRIAPRSLTPTLAAWRQINQPNLTTQARLPRDGTRAAAASSIGALAQHTFTDGGFTRFRRATETPFNLVPEARP